MSTVEVFILRKFINLVLSSSIQISHAEHHYDVIFVILSVIVQNCYKIFMCACLY